MCHVVVNLLCKPWLGWNPFIWSEGSCLSPDMCKSGFTITFGKENVCVYYCGRPFTLRANPMFTSLVMKFSHVVPTLQASTDPLIQLPPLLTLRCCWLTPLFTLLFAAHHLLCSPFCISGGQYCYQSLSQVIHLVWLWLSLLQWW